ncbi:c-type cytochrome [Bartonella sp. DGB2]|uniref:c-type cytochrome n=1 Tax=Bartonella sp. DGB2 TaxID=3388426 RepID=UPI00399025C6
MTFLTKLIKISVLFYVGTFALYANATETSGFLGDATRGKQVFNRCATCHYVDKYVNKIGPSLKNLIGRRAGSLEGYKFSPAMVAAGQNGLIWNRKALIAFLRDPHQKVKGTRMAAIKIKKNQEIEDLIAYLESASH